MDESQNSIETWRAVLGWEGLYEVSSFGNVRSVKTSPYRTGRILSPKLDRYGYPSVLLFKVGKKSYRSVHQLVCEAFHGPRPEKHQVNHIDGIKKNNHQENLEWVTGSRNYRHAIAMGLMRRTRDRALLRGEKHQKVKSGFGEDEVRKIRATTDRSELRAIAEKFGMKYNSLWNIKSRLTWKHVD